MKYSSCRAESPCCHSETEVRGKARGGNYIMTF